VYAVDFDILKLMPDEKDFRKSDGLISYCCVPGNKKISDCKFWSKGKVRNCLWLRNGNKWCGRLPDLNNETSTKE
jgi:hypothetical protein